MPNRTGKNRLLKLADLLEADAKNRKGVKFDLGLWGSTEDIENIPVSVSCGTTACAVGLAVVSGAFKRSGLTNGASFQGKIVPKFEGELGFEAVEKFFNLSNRESDFLFTDEYYTDDQCKGAKGERAVAKRIRQFVADKVAP